MRAAIYTRYSSENQREASLEDQERRCRAEAARAGFTVVAVWQDAALSGQLGDDQRPGL
jgi:DNA invertase Pin-like site-specific DNA recombinase